MAGDYTDITAIDVPSEAASGETVNVTVKAKNTLDYAFRIGVTASVDGTDLYFDWGTSSNPVWVDPGDTASYSDSFTMPDKEVTITVATWFWDGEEWVKDDEEEKDISLAGGGGGGGGGPYYAEITNVDVPSEAAEGQTVNVAVTVKNNAQNNSIYDHVTGRVGANGAQLQFGDRKEVSPLGTATFNDSFTMPGESVTLYIWSWYWDGDNWVKDDEEEKDVSLATVAYEFVISKPTVHAA